MFELALLLGVCATMALVINIIDRFGGDQDYSG